MALHIVHGRKLTIKCTLLWSCVVTAEDGTQVPYWQSRIVQGCRKRGKPVIVATNMLESMIGNPTPTRAEVSTPRQCPFTQIAHHPRKAEHVRVCVQSKGGQHAGADGQCLRLPGGQVNSGCPCEVACWAR